ncbi:coiled-coil domain-containing protein 177 [Rhagoletis pomonella]|uniref:coiled-coil domain-containing protein 177 n=1 Tax=Rhagoletis pomonella TaxID=28610 RepID=UPI00178292A6|nr:coiled-coil domain-containing protein 177 [Rhagoletis pomonella]
MHGRAAERSTLAEEHLRLLAELDSLALSDSCCEICHCDCYSSHRSSLDSDRRICVEAYEKIDANPVPRSVDNNEKTEKSKYAAVKLGPLSVPQLFPTVATPSTSIGHNISKKRSSRKSKGTRKKNAHEITASNSNSTKPSSTQAITSVNPKSKSAKNTPTNSRRTSPSVADACGKSAKANCSTSVAAKRSKSVSSLRSRSPSPLTAPVTRNVAKRATFYTRDCTILQDLLGTLNDDEHNDATASLQVSGRSALKQTNAIGDADPSGTTQSHTLPRCAIKSKDKTESNDGAHTSLTSQKLCASMASLCLAPTVRVAYQQVPAHDKRILNRMAHKRSERAIAKENAWLARKYWENERYERELFKCAQMEEYKRAIRDKQFQDYLLTKARLNEIAQRDLTELRRLREALHQKEISTKRRLDALRVERGIAACQRRCEELRRAEAVAVQQEEQQIDEKLRKQESCVRLSERLQRAEQIRSEMLDSYLRRLRYDNNMEELLHEEHWREAQQQERQRLAQLEEHIQQKSDQSQRFIEARQRRQEAIAKTAKISASLRELVRNSVTPEGGAAADVGGVGDAVSIGNTMPLSKVLLDIPFSKLSMLP